MDFQRYRVWLYAVSQRGQERIGTTSIEVKAYVYYQDVMDNLAEAIAKYLHSSTDDRKDLSHILEKLSLPWSKVVQKLALILSDDMNVFAGREGRKIANELSRPRDACKGKQVPTAKCQEVTLKNGSQDGYIFTWPGGVEQNPGVNVQLRFYYETFKGGWYASKVYSVGSEDMDTETGTEPGTTKSKNSKALFFQGRL
ncbi:hypothetical protein Ciccas_011429 [Cichlidogyrus casuarinus]|uniref:Uncharacterized protein n=1 Tax=Cichlidogyrus casuarinus TaxID=1844966 RepID=A0ABD2PSY4_9PLAT